MEDDKNKWVKLMELMAECSGGEWSLVEVNDVSLKFDGK